MKRKSNNDSGLTALAVSLLTAIAVSFIACNTVQLAPLDDAYYYPDKKATPAVQNTPSTQTTPSTPTVSQGQSQQSSVEYVNIQDTTVTIRIKK